MELCLHKMDLSHVAAYVLSLSLSFSLSLSIYLSLVPCLFVCLSLSFLLSLLRSLTLWVRMKSMCESTTRLVSVQEVCECVCDNAVEVRYD